MVVVNKVSGTKTGSSISFSNSGCSGAITLMWSFTRRTRPGFKGQTCKVMRTSNGCTAGSILATMSSWKRSLKVMDPPATAGIYNYYFLRCQGDRCLLYPVEEHDRVVPAAGTVDQKRRRVPVVRGRRKSFGLYPFSGDRP